MAVAGRQPPAPSRIAGDDAPHYIGLMSGTSTDGIDAVLARFDDDQPPAILAHCSRPIPQDLRKQILLLNHPGPDELARAAQAANALADVSATAVRALLADTALAPADIAAIGAHGQTVRHAPAAGYTWQINAPARLAEQTGIAVVADFRSRDIAAGGQGAPLVPAFHQAVFASQQPRIVLNLGGIANITALEPGRPVTGFDTGPANVLLDVWAAEKTGQPMDRNGAWAATGRVRPDLLKHFIESEPWFALPPPKSTGRDRFNQEWLHARLGSRPASARDASDADIQATLMALTGQTVMQAIARHTANDTMHDILVCGGGALNPQLMATLKRLAPAGSRVASTAEYGIDVQVMEALAFAWLARAWDLGEAAGLPEVTGAAGRRILGCKYPA